MANCENFKIHLQNDTPDEVKVTKIEYKDGSKWKAENMFGLDGHQELERGQCLPFKRGLESVGNESTQFRVTYQHHIGCTKWGPDKCGVAGAFVARDNEDMRVVLSA